MGFLWCDHKRRFSNVVFKMGKINLTSIALVLFGLYVLNSLYVLYHFFYIPACTAGSKACLHPHQSIDGQLEVALYTSTKQNAKNSNSMELVWKNNNFSVFEPFSLSINVSIPRKTRKNGTLFGHLFVYPRGKTPFDNFFTSQAVEELTIYAVPKDESVNLLSSANNEKKTPSHADLPISHWRKKLSFHILSEKVVFERFAIPAEIYPLIRVTADEQYLPLLYADQLQVKYRHIQPLNKTSVEMPLIVEYSPISLGRLRLWSSVHHSLALMKTLGFSDKDLDDIRGLFTEINMYLLALTFAISIFHILFDFLAFKNDISFWKKRDSMVGLSSRTVVWRCVSSFIIFLYLLDEKASLLVSIPSGIGTLIEAWKLTKAFKIEIDLRHMKIKFGERSSKEKETDSFDNEALYYLKYLIYPLVAGSAVYSLIYHPQKSWYSWFIKSLVNGIYVVGFLFMLPQLFVNYRLKSVAHLPWKALMYKAFNTFIDDVFAFIITMPTSHRLACFRDDIVFVVYIYQRWLYPVDKTRVNEYGMSYENDQKEPAIKQHAE